MKCFSFCTTVTTMTNHCCLAHTTSGGHFTVTHDGSLSIYTFGEFFSISSLFLTLTIFLLHI